MTMTEYIDRSTARAEITLAYEDGRIGALEDVLGVLDLIPAAEVGQAGAGGANQDGKTATLHVACRDGEDGVGGTVRMHGPEDLILGGLIMMAAEVARELGCEYAELCHGLVAIPARKLQREES